MMTVKEIQRMLGVTVDGVAGPRTMAALRAKHFDVVIDAGHTSDYAREHPNAWPSGAWSGECGRVICAALRMDAATPDSVEHRLNVAVAKAAAAHLEACDKRVLLYDDPAMSNNAELTQAWKLSNGAMPACFVSIHANASSGVQHYATNTACGSVALYPAGRDNGRQLARDIVSSLVEMRQTYGGPHNRADVVLPSSVGVLRNSNASIAATLVEVGFYDTEADLYWMSQHIDDMGAAIARGVLLNLTRK